MEDPLLAARNDFSTDFLHKKEVDFTEYLCQCKEADMFQLSKNIYSWINLISISKYW